MIPHLFTKDKHYAKFEIDEIKNNIHHLLQMDKEAI